MQLKRILCPSDFSDSSERALAYAVHLLKEAGGHVEILHVFEQPVYIAPPGQPHTEQGARHYFERHHAELRDALEQAAAQHAHPRVSLGFQTCEGVAEHEIAERSADFDLIVMATHSRTGVARLFFGSVVARVLLHARCPVLTIPPELDVRSDTASAAR